MIAVLRNYFLFPFSFFFNYCQEINTYNMDAPVLGHVLIVNNLVSEFTRSMSDVQAALEAYGSLGFRVHVHISCDKKFWF